MDIEKIEGVNYTKAWSTKRVSILNKYTTGEKLTIVSSYLPGGEKGIYYIDLTNCTSCFNTIMPTNQYMFLFFIFCFILS